MKKIIILLVCVLTCVFAVNYFLISCPRFAENIVENKGDEFKIGLINKYSTIKFPKETLIETFILKKDSSFSFFYRDFYIEATLFLPSNKIDEIFPEKIRVYDEREILDLSYGKTDEIFGFGAWFPKTVVQWFNKTQRNIYFTVMKSEEGNTKVYVFIDKLGWRES